MMDGTPDFGKILGKSTLFDSGFSASTTGPNGVLNDEGQCGKEYEGPITNSFISSKGKVIKLRRKRIGAMQPQMEQAISSLSANKAAWREDENYGININTLLDKIQGRDSSNVSAKLPSRKSRKPQKNRGGDRLWVERWCPKNFLDLVGNEKTNRRVLRWLRQWSPCVFNEQLPTAPFGNNEHENFDPLQRPVKRILLIHGPPGIGKTSVAHVAAKQAGYSVAEINASDERGGGLVRDKIHNTLFNHTFSERPACLVADEIDGSIEGGFIKVLVDIIKKDAQATQKHILGSSLKSRTKSRKKSSNILVRPIIAICNNLYAPALEKLKPLCEIISVRRPSDRSLQERLEHICKVEGLEMSVKVLKELMELAQGDVRNCVNNLQFLASHQQSHTDCLNGQQNALESVSKDFSQSWFKICNQMFRKDPHQELKKQLQDRTKLVELNGNFDRVVQGCHSLFPFVKYSDNGVKKPAEIADWLFYHDLMFKSLFEHNGELLSYSAIVPLAFFHFFGDIANREDLRIQNSDFERRESQRGNQDIVKLLLHRLSIESPSIMSFSGQESMILETLPYIDSMISSDLSKCRDLKLKQTIFDELIGILRCFQLDMVEKYHEDASAKKILSVEPPIDGVVLLDPQRQREVLTKRPAILNMLMARAEESKARIKHLKQTTENKTRNEEIRDNRAKNGMNGVNTVDFFKNQYGYNDKNAYKSGSRPLSKEKGETGRARSDDMRIWVKYKEGFSDAVRKNVSWGNLWEQ